MFKILVADDEHIILEPISDYMSAKGIDVDTAKNGSEALELAENNNYDLIILDVMMPVMDGIEACREIRKFSDTPILFLSALGEEYDLLKGYQSGCDDYIVKPFPLAVLYQKIISMIKRSRSISAENKLKAGNVILDFNCRKVYASEKETTLSAKDFDLLAYLIENKGITISRDLILTRIWGYDFDGDTRVVDTHIKRIRKALGSDGDIIKTVFGVGYSVEV